MPQPSSPRRSILLASALLLVAGFLSAQIGQPPAPATPSDVTVPTVSVEKLGGADRFISHIATDKPFYRAGEQARVRVVLLHAVDATPFGPQVEALVEIVGPKGETVGSGMVRIVDGAGGFAWPVPEGQAGGLYKVRVTHPLTGFAPGEREFEVRAYRAPRLKTQIEFLRDGYGPGDMVEATAEISRAEGGVPEGALVTVIGRVDGVEVHRDATTLDALGIATGRFPLPREMARGEGTVVFVVEDGGVVETAAKTIPILLQTVDLEFYPEGGDLVAGLINRVYVEARTPADRPADIAGFIRDSRGTVVAALRTEHEGRGRFDLVPAAGERYHLEITEPSGITGRFHLPEIQPHGTVLGAVHERYRKERDVPLRVASSTGGTFRLSLSKREVELAATVIELGAGEERTVTLTPAARATGVLRATLTDASGVPIAERLLFREPGRSLRVSVELDRSRYVPGGDVELTVRTTDEHGNAVGAVIGLTVSDDSVLEMVEKREQAPRLPAMVLLESDVRELADAHIYLDPDEPLGPKALDLLLGTQGWRRFAFVAVDSFLEQHGDDARRALALREAAIYNPGPGGWDAQTLALGRGLRWRAFADGKALRKQEGLEVLFAGEPVGAPAPDVPAAAAVPGAPADAEADGIVKNDVPVVDARPNAQPVAPAEVELKVHAKRILDEARGDAMEAERIVGLLQAVPSSTLVLTREFAHIKRPDRRPGDRVDFTETVYWNAGVKTDAETGQARVKFALSDAVTSFRIHADAFDAEGRLGHGTDLLESVEPFYIEPKLPLEVTEGDEILVPVGVVNGTDTTMSDVTLMAGVLEGIDISGLEPFALDGGARIRRVLRFQVGAMASGERSVLLEARAGVHGDRVTRPLRVVPRGFPVERAFGAMLDAGSSVAFTVEIPDSVVPGSLTSEAVVYPTPLANLTSALERLIREPCGCFEQTSSSNYPLTMAQQYFLTHTGVDPALIEKSRALLARGYERLLSFECKSGGFEWFGQDPGHEALTAYGLLEFTDMAKVRAVDADMMARTRKWLLDRRDGKGSFKRERRALHTWITDRDCSNGYILWALLESGEKPQALAQEIAFLGDAALGNPNSYVTALGAVVLGIAGEHDLAADLRKKLAARQQDDGSVAGATTSIVGSGGQSLIIETTSLAVLTWLTDPAYTDATEKAIRYLASSCKSGRFGSTQATILALKAIIAHDQARSRPKAPGMLQLLVDGEPFGEPVAFDESNKGPIALPAPTTALTPGSPHTIEVRMADGSSMPCSVTVEFHDEVPDSSAECAVAIAVTLRDDVVVEGNVTEAEVTVVNRRDDAVPTPIAVVGLPGGLEVRHDQLKELVDAGRIAAYEIRGREVVLYWRSLEGGQEVRLPLSLVAAIPGRYRAPASRAYLYYTDEHKTWVEGPQVEITPL